MMEIDPGAPRARSSVLDRWLGAPRDIASLAAFRVLFGLLMATAMIRFLARGWVNELYLLPQFHFTYPGFGWVRPLPDPLMHAHFIALAILGLMVAAGFCYRAAILLFFLGFTYVELIDQTAYLNHYYLVSLLSGLMIFLPAHRAWSIDAQRRPALKLDVVPVWTIDVLRFQVAVVYFFAGLAKLNADWLLQSQPLRIWLAARSDLPLLGPLLNPPWVAFAASWFGAFYDLTIVFFLMRRRTRRMAFLAVIFFHVATWVLFNIGMFPWIMIVATTLFFPADWPRHWLSRFSAFVSGAFKAAQVARRVNATIAVEHPPRTLAAPATRLLPALLALYAVVQLALPLRPYLAAQPSAWTCSGFNCAWQVMIAEKTGYAELNAFDPAAGKRWKLSLNNYLTPRQEMMMAQDPYLIRALARRLSRDLRRLGYGSVQIRADAFATLNGRPSQRLIDPEVDLAGTLPPGWILPLAR